MNAYFSVADDNYMEKALEEAVMAIKHDDVPVGAVLVDNKSGEILATGHNNKNKDGNVTGHAEILALQEACSKKGTWRLTDCTLYVTLEPCPMCAGAIVAARIPKVICGTKDPIAGAMGSVWAINSDTAENSHTTILFGCKEKESKDLLKNFFKRKRI